MTFLQNVMKTDTIQMYGDFGFQCIMVVVLDLYFMWTKLP